MPVKKIIVSNIDIDSKMKIWDISALFFEASCLRFTNEPFNLCKWNRKLSIFFRFVNTLLQPYVTASEVK